MKHVLATIIFGVVLASAVQARADAGVPLSAGGRGIPTLAFKPVLASYGRILSAAAAGGAEGGHAKFAQGNSPDFTYFDLSSLGPAPDAM